MKRCRNCLYDVKKGIRRCPYCGVLNPTLELKEIFITIFAVIAVLAVFSLVAN